MHLPVFDNHQCEEAAIQVLQNPKKVTCIIHIGFFEMIMNDP